MPEPEQACKDHLAAHNQQPDCCQVVAGRRILNICAMLLVATAAVDGRQTYNTMHAHGQCEQLQVTVVQY